MDSEGIRSLAADTGRLNKTNGFQGCKNYGGGCGFAGYYLYRYSDEGLCDKCELQYYPERYHGCCFCLKAINYHQSMCFQCEKGFRSWCFNLFYNKNQNSKSTVHEYYEQSENETGDSKLCRMVGYGICDLIDSFEVKMPCSIYEKPDYTDEWPGFHIGDFQYVKPNAFELKSKIDISDITLENAKTVIERELNKIGINIYSDALRMGTVASEATSNKQM